MELKTANGFFLDEDRLINMQTGEEIEDPILLAVPPGTRISTPDEREQRLEAMEARLAHQRFKHRDGESYFFIRRDTFFDDVPPAMVTKLFYLSTFAHFGDNVLMMSQRTKMKRKDLAGVLRVSVGSASNFWNTVSPMYLMQDGEENLLLNNTLFQRGRLQRNNFTPYIQMYDTGIRSLYAAAGGRHHKPLGYLFKMLPYFNVEYNLVCCNPDEEDLERLQPMSISQFCAEIGYNRSNISKLKWFFDNFRFEVGERYERFCRLLYKGLDSCDAVICVNPAIMFSGSNQSRLEIIEQFFGD